MVNHPIYDEKGWRLVEAYDDRCPHYRPRPNALNVYRCVSCAFFNAGRCLEASRRAAPLKSEKEDRDGR